MSFETIVVAGASRGIGLAVAEHLGSQTDRLLAVSRKIMPAPRKPMPVMMFDTIREAPCASIKLLPTIVYIAAPMQTAAYVRMPAPILCLSRSKPMNPPRKKAVKI